MNSKKSLASSKSLLSIDTKSNWFCLNLKRWLISNVNRITLHLKNNFLSRKIIHRILLHMEMPIMSRLSPNLILKIIKKPSRQHHLIMRLWKGLFIKALFITHKIKIWSSLQSKLAHHIVEVFILKVNKL